VLAAGRWTHVAVSWSRNTDGSYFVIVFIDGVALVYNPAAPGPFPGVGQGPCIGQLPAAPQPGFDGYLDEVRWWSGAVTETIVRRRMFSSGRDHVGDGDAPLAMWNFDGNLYSHVDYDVSGTFANGLTNNARFSAYTNEASPGAFASGFHAHPTVLNRTRTGSPTSNLFASAFTLRGIKLAIGANSSVSDTLTVPANTPGTKLELMLSLSTAATANSKCRVDHAGHHYPIYEYSLNNASDVLSFFSDDLPGVLGTASYPAPWGFVKPSSSFVLTAPAAGTWTLVCTTTGLNTATIRGWGVRFY
jgi:hypothetical protein